MLWVYHHKCTAIPGTMLDSIITTLFDNDKVSWDEVNRLLYRAEMAEARNHDKFCAMGKVLVDNW